MLATIERLPVEVFEIIALDLDLLAYNALRLTSRQLQLLSFSSYAKRYFSELKTTLGSASLDRLINVARHRYLSDTVTVLDITLLNHRDYKLLKNISRVGRFPIPKRFPKVSGVKLENTSTEATLYDDVLKSEYPKCIVDRLASSLKALSNLKGVRFRAHHSEPYGWRSASMPEGDQLFRTKCFHAVVDAIIKSEINLTEFSTAKGKRMTTLSKCANLPYPALSLPLHCLQALQHRFTSLESLTLSVIAAYNGDARIPGWENGLSNLIATAPSITSLALSLDRNYQISHYSAAIVRSLALSCRIPGLESLQLVNCSVHEEYLIALVQAHAKSLHQLILADIRLLTGSWLSLWSSFKNLDSLHFLRLASLEGINSPVIFRRRDKERLKITLNVEKAGLPMATLLDNLSTACSMEIDLQSNGIEAE